MRKVPETIESFEPLAAQLLSDRHHGVLLTGVALMLDVCELHPASVETYRRCSTVPLRTISDAAFWCCVQPAERR